MQTLQALAQLVPTAGFWQRIVFSALRILTGFLLAVVGGLVLGALGARWRWVRIFIEPAMQLDPRHASSQLCHPGFAVGAQC